MELKMNYLDLLKLNTNYSKVFDNVLKENLENCKNIYITECAQNVSRLYASKMFLEKKQNIVYVTPTIYDASRAYEALCEMVGTDNVSFFPVEEFISSELVATSEAFRLARMLTIYSILENVPKIIVTNTEGLVRQLMSKDKLQQAVLKIKVNDILNRDELIESLVIRGYKKVAITSTSGTFSIRGSLIDVFPINEDTAYRISFFDDEVEVIKTIDIETQMSTGKQNSVEIFPLHEVFYAQSDVNTIKSKILKDFTINDRIKFVIESL